MPKYVKASNFTMSTLERAAVRVPTQAACYGGRPGALNGLTEHIIKAYDILKTNHALPKSNYTQPTDAQIALMCFSGLTISVKKIPDTEPVKTMFKDESNPQRAINTADRINQTQKKNYATTMFPDPADPFHQMDDVPSDHVKKITDMKQENIDYRSVVGMLASISAINTCKTIPDSKKIKQLVEKKKGSW